MSTLTLTRRARTRDRLARRIQVAANRRKLDAALAGGADPASDPARALRAQQLCEPRTRQAVARTIRHLLDAAEEPPSAWRRGDPRPRLQRAAVLDAQPALIALTERLTQPGRVPQRAIALASQLAWDPTSPIYTEDPETSVTDSVRTILTILDRDRRPSVGSPVTP